MGIVVPRGTHGGYVVQLARAEGPRAVADAAPRDRDLVREFGAAVIADRADDVSERIRRAALDALRDLVERRAACRGAECTEAPRAGGAGWRPLRPSGGVGRRGPQGAGT